MELEDERIGTPGPSRPSDVISWFDAEPINVVESLMLSGGASATDRPEVIVEVEYFFGEPAIIGIAFEEEGLSTPLSVHLVPWTKSRCRDRLQSNIPYDSAEEAD